MKPLVSLARKILDSLASGQDGRGGEPWRTTPLLLVSGQESDRKTLEQMLFDTRWNLWVANSCLAGMERLKAVRIPVVLYDRDLPDSDWRATMAALRSLPDPARIILLSHASDHSLWEDVIELGGFDVLTRPIRKADLIQTLECALRLWQQRGGGHGSSTR